MRASGKEVLFRFIHYGRNLMDTSYKKIEKLKKKEIKRNPLKNVLDKAFFVMYTLKVKIIETQIN